MKDRLAPGNARAAVSDPTSPAEPELSRHQPEPAEKLLPFRPEGELGVAWHGDVSPCPPLLHSYTCYLRGWKKFFRRCEYGHLPEKTLREIWTNPEYAAFRERVRKFEFSPCTDCGGCDDGERNETDCFGNPFPVCGDCLWARGVLRCG